MCMKKGKKMPLKRKSIVAHVGFTITASVRYWHSKDRVQIQKQENEHTQKTIEK